MKLRSSALLTAGLVAALFAPSCSSDDSSAEPSPSPSSGAGASGAAGGAITTSGAPGATAGAPASGGAASSGAAGAPFALGGAPAQGGSTGGDQAGAAGMTGLGGEGGQGGQGGEGGGSAGGSKPVGVLPGVPLSCAAEVAEKPSFVDASSKWGLSKDALGVYGNRFTAADLDNDGYPDLIVHRIGSNARTDVEAAKADPKAWGVRVLMNRPRDGGGRTFVDATLDSNYGALAPGQSSDKPVLRAAHLAVAADVDNDGDLDLFSGTYTDPTADPAKNPDTGDRSQILLNDGKGVFTLAPASDPTPPTKFKWPTTGATFTDTDRDGRVDLFVGFWYKAYGQSDLGVQAQLYKGAGDGAFTAITYDAGLGTSANASSFDEGKNHKPAYGVTSCDLDDDGAPELLVSVYGRQYNSLYHNDGTGKFAEVGRPSGYAGDDQTDFSDNQFFACYCTVHKGDDPACEGVKSPIVQCPSPADSYWDPSRDAKPWRNNGNTFTTFCGDIDGDGKNDLYSAEIHHWHIGKSSDSPQILVNSTAAGGPLTFTRVDNEVSGTVIPHPTTDWNEGGIVAGGGDLDNDGRPELFLGTSDYPDQFGWVYHQKGDGKFEEVGEGWGLHHACVSGLAIADFDRDGDLDIVVGSGTARDCAKTWDANYVMLYENSASQLGKGMAVRLKGDGVTANRAGIGAKISVTTGALTQVREIGGGFGHMGMQHDTTAFFGLGACQTIDRITVRWPSSPPVEQVFEGVTPATLIELDQTSQEAKVIIE